MDSEKEASRLRQDDGRRSAPVCSLDSMSGSDFVLSIVRAKKEATDRAEVLDDMEMWVERLKPYFEFDPETTVAQALQLYLRDRPKRTQRKNAKPADSD